jgi:hypothetical protein
MTITAHSQITDDRKDACRDSGAGTGIADIQKKTPSPDQVNGVFRGFEQVSGAEFAPNAVFCTAILLSSAESPDFQ